MIGDSSPRLGEDRYNSEIRRSAPKVLDAYFPPNRSIDGTES